MGPVEGLMPAIDGPVTVKYTAALWLRPPSAVLRCAATGAERGECVMSWCIDKEQSGDIDGNFSDCATHGTDRFNGNDRCTDVLGDLANL